MLVSCDLNEVFFPISFRFLLVLTKIVGVKEIKETVKLGSFIIKVILLITNFCYLTSLVKSQFVVNVFVSTLILDKQLNFSI